VWTELKQFCDEKKPDNGFKSAAQRRQWVLKTFDHKLQKDMLPFCYLVAKVSSYNLRLALSTTSIIAGLLKP
jgi:hypothetical protein